MRWPFFLCTALAAGFAAPALARGLAPGDYLVGNGVPAVQRICLKSDGTWYGELFNFGGYWINDPSNIHDSAAIYGAYSVQGRYGGYGNDTITVLVDGGGAFWYDWLDDNSYSYSSE